MSNHIDKLRIFCIAVESFSFKEAAQKLSISPQVVTRSIKDLENVFGEILFVRSTRNIQITQFGEDVYQQVKPAMTQLTNIFHHIDEHTSVRIAAPSIVCSHFLMPLVNKMKIQEPQLCLDFKLSDSHSNVVNERIDIGIRAGLAMKDNRFVMRTIGQFGFSIVATPDLVQHHGEPTQIEHLDHCPLIALYDIRSNRLWQWSFANDIKYTPQKPVLTCDDAESELSAILNGVGFGHIPNAIAEPYIQSGQLISVLDQFAAQKPWELYIYRPQKGPVPARVRFVFDFLVNALQESGLFPPAN